MKKTKYREGAAVSITFFGIILGITVSGGVIVCNIRRGNIRAERFFNFLMGNNYDITITPIQQNRICGGQNIPMHNIGNDESYLNLFGDDTPPRSTPKEPVERAEADSTQHETLGHGTRDEGENEPSQDARRPVPTSSTVPDGHDPSNSSTPPHFSRTPGHTYMNVKTLKRQAPNVPDHSPVRPLDHSSNVPDHSPVRLLDRSFDD